MEWVNRFLSDKRSELMEEHRKCNTSIEGYVNKRNAIIEEIDQIDRTLMLIGKDE